MAKDTITASHDSREFASNAALMRQAGGPDAEFAGTAAGQRARNMEVVTSDGEPIGIVDHVEGTTITLKPVDPSSGGSHRSVPTAWVQSVDRQIHLKVTAAVAKALWTTG